MKPLYLIALAVLTSILVGSYVWSSLGGPVGPAKLAQRALSAVDPKDRVRSTVELSLVKDPKALSELQRLATDSKDPEVLIIAIGSLAVTNDHENLPLFYTAMNHTEKQVREAGLEAALRMHFGVLPENLKYHVDDPEIYREEVTRRLQTLYAEKKNQPRPGPGELDNPK